MAVTPRNPNPHSATPSDDVIMGLQSAVFAHHAMLSLLSLIREALSTVSSNMSCYERVEFSPAYSVEPNQANYSCVARQVVVLRLCKNRNYHVVAQTQSSDFLACGIAVITVV